MIDLADITTAADRGPGKWPAPAATSRAISETWPYGHEFAGPYR